MGKSLNEHYAEHLKEVYSYKMLSAQEEVDALKKLLSGEECVISDLFCTYHRMAVQIAETYKKKYAPSGNSIDFIQYAEIGLGKALERYPRTRKLNFCDYAKLRINRELTRYVLSFIDVPNGGCLEPPEDGLWMSQGDCVTCEYRQQKTLCNSQT